MLPSLPVCWREGNMQNFFPKAAISAMLRWSLGLLVFFFPRKGKQIELCVFRVWSDFLKFFFLMLSDQLSTLAKREKVWSTALFWRCYGLLCHHQASKFFFLVQTHEEVSGLQYCSRSCCGWRTCSSVCCCLVGVVSWLNLFLRFLQKTVTSSDHFCSKTSKHAGIRWHV